MIRGTTPTHTFKVNVNLSNAEVIYLTYKQGDKVTIEKTKEDMEITPTTISVRLTQEDTLAFTKASVEVQIRARFSDGTAIASNIMRATSERILKNGVI